MYLEIRVGEPFFGILHLTKLSTYFYSQKKIVTVIAYFQKYNFINLQTHTFQNVMFNFLYFLLTKLLNTFLILAIIKYEQKL